jgi:hypothetical protein
MAQETTKAEYSVHHTTVTGPRPRWLQYDGLYRDKGNAVRRAYNLALEHGGYVCVKDLSGAVTFGTDPAALDRAIASGLNRDFAATPHPDTAVSP